MAIKEFTYRGRNVEELKKLSMGEFAQLLPARQRRTITRGFTDAQKKLLIAFEKKDAPKTHCRDMIILPMMVGRRVQIHNGRSYVNIVVVPEMIGHIMGEFALTRKSVEHHAPGIGATKSSAALSVR
jgi:small subunit ribosomal protein S19